MPRAIARFSFTLFVFFALAIDPASAELELVHPENNPVSASKRQRLDQHLEAAGSHSLLILKDGRIAYQYGDIHQRLTVHSIRKAILSSLVGIQLAAGNIELDSTLAELSIDDIAPELSEQEKQATVRDLLRSRSGVYHDAAANAPSMLRNRPERGSHAPGEHFYYNNWDFNALGAIVEQAAGESLYAFFHRAIASRLGMVDWRNEITTLDNSTADIPNADGFYQYEKEKSQFPAFHFRLSAHDLALYGQLMLQQGQWQGEQLVPAEWIERSTQPYSDYAPGANMHYGMLWKVRVNEAGEMTSFNHTGVGVHYLGVYPSSRLVIVHRVDTESDSDFEPSSLYRLFGVIFGA